MDSILSIVVSKTANSNPRTKKSCVLVALQVAQTEGFGSPYMAGHIQRLQKKDKSNWKILLGRFELLHETIDAIYTRFPNTASSNGPMSTPSIIDFVKIGINNPNGKTRNAAILVAVDMYKFRGIDLQAHLTNIKPALRDLIQQEISKTGTLEEKSPTPDQQSQVAKKPFKNSKTKEDSSDKIQNKLSPPPKDLNHDDIPIQPAKSSRYFELDVEQEDPIESMEDYPEPGDPVEARICPFCGVQDDKLEDKSYEEMHWLEECPMLMACPLCTKIIEIVSLNYHLLEECGHKDLVVECPRCLEAIPTDEAKEHIKLKQCNPAQDTDEFLRCPLCHQDVETWETHILYNKCPMNPRTQIDVETDFQNADVRESEPTNSVKRVSARVFGVN